MFEFLPFSVSARNSISPCTILTEVKFGKQNPCNHHNCCGLSENHHAQRPQWPKPVDVLVSFKWFLYFFFFSETSSARVWIHQSIHFAQQTGQARAETPEPCVYKAVRFRVSTRGNGFLSNAIWTGKEPISLRAYPKQNLDFCFGSVFVWTNRRVVE